MSRQGRKRKREYKNIKNFWENESMEWGNSPRVTIRDHYFRIHEINTLLSLIPKCHSLLDIGCGTGFGTLFFSQKANITYGVDYSENMIKWANYSLENSEYRQKIISEFCPLFQPKSAENIRFFTNDLLSLDLDKEFFDVITGQRILINIPTHNEQMRSLCNLREYARNDTLLLLVEATKEGHKKTDNFRARFDLPILEKYWHNKYVEEIRFSEWIKQGWQIKDVLGFDTYMLLSKVIYPAALGQENCTFESEANFAAMETANIFRTKNAVDEIGLNAVLKLYCNRLFSYNETCAEKIQIWIKNNIDYLNEWKGIGHQKLIIAQAI